MADKSRPFAVDREAPAVAAAVRALVIANRVLAFQGIMDAFGHVSVRHPEGPDRFLLAQSRSPALVTAADMMQFHQDGAVATPDDRPAYAERFIHGSIYRARPDVNAVVHTHAVEVLPFTVASAPLRPVVHSAGVIGGDVPVWDIRDAFGDTNMLVDDDAKGRDLAAHLGDNDVILMRGHGFSAAARDLIELLRIAIYVNVNAAVLAKARALGDVTYLSPGEIDLIRDVGSGAAGLRRAWEYWAVQAGCAELL